MSARREEMFRLPQAALTGGRTPREASTTMGRSDVIAGHYGDGEVRRKALGSRYAEAQRRVNQLLS